MWSGVVFPEDASGSGDDGYGVSTRKNPDSFSAIGVSREELNQLLVGATVTPP